MKNHVYRPLIVVICLVFIVLLIRAFYVPKDFGIHERIESRTGELKKSYMYGWYRKGNIDDWKNVSVKYQGIDYCKACHSDKYESISRTPHAIIQCENCHGPAIEHPSNPPKLTIDRSRNQCLRCHARFDYPMNARSNIRGIDPERHNPDIECVMCHNPHNPYLGGLK